MAVKTILPHPITNQDDYTRKIKILNLMESVSECLQFGDLKTIDNLAFALAFSTSISQKFSFNEVNMLKNMNLLLINPDGTIEKSKAFPYYLQRLKCIITIAQKKRNHHESIRVLQ